MTRQDQVGEIITFYSYKGGTGRSMALSNVACLLAEQHERQKKNGKGVLMIDWDLEAPGLHRFFYDELKPKTKQSKNVALAFDQRPGLIDLFRKLDKATPESGYENEDEAESAAAELLNNFDLRKYIVQTAIPSLRLLKAGKFDDEYSTRVNTFNWERLYQRSPYLIRHFADRLAQEYEYVLIDSRTGHTDISGICTMLMPQKLVVVFTPNRQSLTGILELVRRATKYRRESDDLRPLLVFPLPSRIEATREDLRTQWRFGNTEREIDGYQILFTSLFREVYELKECKLGQYFDEIQIQQSPNYAYGEDIAVRVEKQHDRFSLTTSFKTFAQWLAGPSAPWEKQRPPSHFKYDVYISYSASDRPWAKKFCDSLEARNIRTFMDNSRLKEGQTFESALVESLKSSQHLVVLWSGHAAASDWVRRETGFFEASVDPVFSGGSPIEFQDERRLVLLILEGELPPYGSVYQIDDLRNTKSYDAGADSIAPEQWQELIDKVEKAIVDPPSASAFSGVSHSSK